MTISTASTATPPTYHILTQWPIHTSTASDDSTGIVSHATLCMCQDTANANLTEIRECIREFSVTGSRFWVPKFWGPINMLRTSAIQKQSTKRLAFMASKS